MNGAATRIGGPAGGPFGQRGNGFAPSGRLPAPGPQPVVTPPGKTLVEGYRKDILNGFEKDKARYNPVRVLEPALSCPKPVPEWPLSNPRLAA